VSGLAENLNILLRIMNSLYYLQAHCQSRTSQCTSQSFVKELAKKHKPNSKIFIPRAYTIKLLQQDK